MCKRSRGGGIIQPFFLFLMNICLKGRRFKVYSSAFDLYHRKNMAVETRIIKINLGHFEQEELQEVVDVLKKGGIVVYPTDTFYGLGANAYLVEAVKKIYILKARDPAKPVPLVVSGLIMAKDMAVMIPSVFEVIAHKFWPGPLTVILKAAPHIPAVLQSPEGSVGIRWPDHPWLRTLIERAGFPLTATSANLKGEKEMSDPEEVLEVFSGKVDLIVDGGKCPGLSPSTVIDLTHKRPRILREGALPASELIPYFEKPSLD